MKKIDRARTLLCAAAAAALLAAFAAMASGGAGSQTDPLVTLSYLTDTFTTQILEEVDTLLAQRNAALREELLDKLPDGEAYVPVTLSVGQVLRGEAGCEALLRTGSARCAGTEGLVDTTSGGYLDGGGALEANHLYLMPEERELHSADGAELLVRGTYEVRQPAGGS